MPLSTVLTSPIGWAGAGFSTVFDCRSDGSPLLAGTLSAQQPPIHNSQSRYTAIRRQPTPRLIRPAPSLAQRISGDSVQDLVGRIGAPQFRPRAQRDFDPVLSFSLGVALLQRALPSTLRRARLSHSVTEAPSQTLLRHLDETSLLAAAAFPRDASASRAGTGLPPAVETVFSDRSLSPLYLLVAQGEDGDRLGKQVKWSGDRLKLTRALIESERARVKNAEIIARKAEKTYRSAEFFHHMFPEDNGWEKVVQAKEAFEAASRDHQAALEQLNRYQQIERAYVLVREGELFGLGSLIESLMDESEPELPLESLSQLGLKLLIALIDVFTARRDEVKELMEEFESARAQVSAIADSPKGRSPFYSLYLEKLATALSFSRNYKDRLAKSLLGFVPAGVYTIQHGRDHIYFVLTSRGDYIQAYYNVSHSGTELRAITRNAWAFLHEETQKKVIERDSLRWGDGSAFRRGISLAWNPTSNEAVDQLIKTHEEHHQGDFLIDSLLGSRRPRMMNLAAAHSPAVARYLGGFETSLWTETLSLLKEDEMGLTRYPAFPFFGLNNYDPLLKQDESRMRTALGKEFNEDFVTEIFLPFYEGFRKFGQEARRRLRSLLDRLEELQNQDLAESSPLDHDRIKEGYVSLRRQMRGYLRLRGLEGIEDAAIVMNEKLNGRLGDLDFQDPVELRVDRLEGIHYSHAQPYAIEIPNLQNGIFRIQPGDHPFEGISFLLAGFNGQYYIRALNSGLWMAGIGFLDEKKYYPAPSQPIWVEAKEGGKASILFQKGG